MKILAQKKFGKNRENIRKNWKKSEIYLRISHNKQHNKRAKRVETRNFQYGGHYLIRLMRTKIQQTTIISSRSCHNAECRSNSRRITNKFPSTPSREKCEKFSEVRTNVCLAKYLPVGFSSKSVCSCLEPQIKLNSSLFTVCGRAT